MIELFLYMKLLYNTITIDMLDFRVWINMLINVTFVTNGVTNIAFFANKILFDFYLVKSVFFSIILKFIFAFV